MMVSANASSVIVRISRPGSSEFIGPPRNGPVVGGAVDRAGKAGRVRGETCAGDSKQPAIAGGVDRGVGRTADRAVSIAQWSVVLPIAVSIRLQCRLFGRGETRRIFGIAVPRARPRGGATWRRVRAAPLGSAIGRRRALRANRARSEKTPAYAPKQTGPTSPCTDTAHRRLALEGSGMSQESDVYTDLVAEADYLDGFVAGLGAEWDLPTPAPGWTVAHQIAHLAFVSTLARQAAAEPAAFAAQASAAKSGFQAAVDGALQRLLADSHGGILERWRRERVAAAEALAAVPAGQMVPWLVNPLPASVLTAAGLMEHFGHGQDVVDALGAQREYTDRIGHVAWFATRTRDFGYEARGLEPPEQEFRFELTAPSGAAWNFGPEDAEQRVSGPAVDFCLLVTRRRHRDDLDLKAVGRHADQWLDIAQAYRGPAGDGRRPGQFAGNSGQNPDAAPAARTLTQS
jgi:uncharacterized protein (TIGR03084 family)